MFCYCNLWQFHQYTLHFLAIQARAAPAANCRASPWAEKPPFFVKNKLREPSLAFVSSTIKDVTRLVLSKDPAKVRMIHTKIGSFKPAQLQIQSLFV